MGLFSLTKEIAIDLGTANTIIIHNDKIVINEPSIVALDNRTDKLIAVGTEAHLMEGKTPRAYAPYAPAQRRYRRLQCSRAHDSRPGEEGIEQKQLVLALAQNGCWHSFRFYRS